MLKAAVFDLDGTIMDSTEAIVESCLYTFARVGAPRPERQHIIDLIGYPLGVQLSMILGRDASDLVPLYREHYGEHAPANTTLLPHAAETLEALRRAGLRIGFATSKKREVSEMLLAHLGVLGYFESRVGPDEVTRHKPDPEALHVSMANLGVGAEEMVFIGDMGFDVNAAHAAGVRCVAVSTGYCTRDELEALAPEMVFDTLEPVPEYLLNGAV